MLYSPRKPMSVAIAATVLATPLAAVSPVYAQESMALEEVVVTARRRDENLQDVPIAVTALSGDDLTLRGAQDILDRVCRVTGAPKGGTSADGKFTVVTVECQGACASAPMFDLDGTYHENLGLEDVDRILGGVEA